MPRKVDQAERDATITNIKATARALMAEKGSVGLSLRAIARAIGLSAPSLYHYYDSLDDLITALIVDAFNAQADFCESARQDAADQPPAMRMFAVIRAYRQYALKYPHDFQLIYGSPIPGYHAPPEVTVPASARTLIAFTRAMVDIFAAGHISVPPEYQHIPPGTLPALRQAAEFAAQMGADHAVLPTGAHGDFDLLPLYLVLAGWGQLHGIVMLELFGHLPPTAGDMDAFYDEQMRHMMRVIGVDMATVT